MSRAVRGNAAHALADDLAGIFGIELAGGNPPPPARPAARAKKPAKPKAKADKAKPTKRKAKASQRKPSKRSAGKPQKR